ncbi:HlyD family secretion protein [Enterobacter kobei]|uniref:HlyD family secretion protein n=1 Tax=Enterobacter kobei TaxID=208224 RepID=UPI002876E9CD|nr:HlyD family efflux transporter periplasmic adaptor subunit [Enterobacter kobei]MDS0025193.1 HlyD family efflux transporter periplasmic adaptor subunit [Enterobacter kobei]
MASRLVSRNAILRESAALSASIAAKESELLSANNSATEALSPLRQRMEELERLEAEVRTESVIAVHSPIDGHVSLLRARTGERVRERSLLAVLLPDGAATEVEAFVPAAQARRIREGQRVRVSFSQFPVGQFGMVDGTVMEAPSVAVRREEVLPDGQQNTDGFLVRIVLTDQAVLAEDVTLRASLGTRAVANIVVDRQPLAGLLLGPLKQAASRLHASRNESELDSLR